jgi:hypothetical protein
MPSFIHNQPLASNPYLYMLISPSAISIWGTGAWFPARPGIRQFVGTGSGALPASWLTNNWSPSQEAALTKRHGYLQPPHGTLLTQRTSSYVSKPLSFLQNFKTKFCIHFPFSLRTSITSSFPIYYIYLNFIFTNFMAVLTKADQKKKKQPAQSTPLHVPVLCFQNYSLVYSYESQVVSYTGDCSPKFYLPF